MRSNADFATSNIEFNDETICICHSVFQADALLKIIKLTGIRPNIIYFSYQDDLKTRYYCEILEGCAKNFYYFGIRERKTFKILPKLIKIILLLRRKNQGVLVASFNAFYPIFCINFLRPKWIRLFDDGSFSFISEEDRWPYLNNGPKNTKQRMLYKLLGMKWSAEDIRKRATIFYTQFPKIQTLVDPDKVIGVNSAFESEGEKIISPLIRGLSIFIGDVVFELSDEDKGLHQRLIANPLIDYYIPHPRNRLNISDINKTLFLDTIAETFIENLVISGFDLKIISLNSTVLFNIRNSKKIRKYMIKNISTPLPSLMRLAAISGIEIIDEAELACALS